LDEQLKVYIDEWRKQRAKELEDLRKLKEKQAKRKTIREEEDKKLAQMKKDEEDRLRREIEAKKQQEMDQKRMRLEESERKRQEADKAAKEKLISMPNFKLGKKAEAAPMISAGPGGMDKFSNVESARQDLNKSKEQLEEEKRISLSFRIQPLNIDNLSVQGLRSKAEDLWNTIINLETEKYDLEERSKRQDYDLKELKERQKQQLRHKALKKGLDPEALTGKYPVSHDEPVVFLCFSLYSSLSL